MIKIKERQRMANIIYGDIVNIIQEFGIKAEKGDLNDVYFLAFQVAMESTIEDSLKKCRIESKQETKT